MTEARSRRLARRWLIAICFAAAMGAGLVALLCLSLAPAVHAPTAATPRASGSAVAGLPNRGPSPSPFPLPMPAAGPASDLVRQEDWLALARSFDVSRAAADVEELCDPAYGGRLPGSEGGRRAAEFLAARFADLGLVPAGDAGSYRQAFGVPLVELTCTPALTLTADGSERYVARFRQGFTPIMSGYTGSGFGEGPVIWVSHGAHADYDGIDASGAVVLCRHPAAEDVLRQAAEHRVAALLILREDAASLQMGRVARDTSWISDTIPAASVSPDVARFLLSGSGLTLDDLTIQYSPLRLRTRASLSVSTREVAAARAQNVLGVLPGRDPARRHEVVVLGAHYDHVGHAPDGTLFPGANDDASGVAALLEIARSWQAAGYVPERTVLFAAWDGEESGLLGSSYYVEHPAFPLTATVAMLQLDMVGAGLEPVLEIDGDGAVQEQTLVSAGELGVAARAATIGRSDHAPFRDRRIPASMLIWAGLEAGGTYHLPADTPASIGLDYLRQAGAVAELVALHLSATQPDLAALVDLQRQALRDGDAEAFIATVSASAQARERTRVACWQEAAPQEVDLALDSVVAAGDVATATLRLSYRGGPERTQRAATYLARFAREGPSWRYAGLATVAQLSPHVRLLSPPSMASGQAADLAALASALYAQLEQVLALPEGGPVTLELYPAGATLDTLVASGAPGGSACRLLAGDGLLASRSAITETVVALALARAGLPAGKLTWLAAGLAEILQERTPAEIAAGDLPPEQAGALASALDRLRPLADLDAGATAPGGETLWRAQARSLAVFLLREGGWPAIARFARAAQAAPTPDEACIRAFGQSAGQLDARWRSGSIQRWLDAGLAISETVRARAQAVATGDEQAFLATVNEGNGTLWVEQQHWFQDVLAHRVAGYTERAVLVELSGDRAVATLTQEVRPADGSTPLRATTRVRFVARGGRWLYDDLAFDARSSLHFTLYFDPQSAPAADALDEILGDAERAWAMLRDDWPATPQQVQIKLYPDGQSFRLSILPSLPAWSTGWTEPGESIKLSRARISDPGPVIAHELTHQVLFAMGVGDAWLHEGVATLAAQAFDPRAFGASVLRRRRELADALRTNRTLDFSAPVSWRELDDEQASLLYTQSWDTVRFLLRRYGQPALRRALELRGKGKTLDQAFLEATGHNLASLLAAWRQSAQVDHFDPEIVAFAAGFDEQQALRTAAELCAPEYAGRAAGTPGADAAASLLAGRFASLDLAPAGDAGSYLQQFPVTSTCLLTTPVLSLARPDGRPIASLRYLQDFQEVVRGHAGAGSVQAEAIWVAQADYGDARLGGRVVFQRLRGDPMALAEMAWKAGAGGLVLILDGNPDLRQRSVYLPELAAETIPVVQIGNETFVGLIKAAGRRMADLGGGRPVVRLGFDVRLSVALQVQPARASNVLALLPGSDKELRNEVIVVGAHYDHVGRLPAGTLYPGANDDASGVGVLLELARVCSQSGWQPRRSILFAAWGAEEMGLKGSRHYAEHPWIPLAQTVAMIQIDMVGRGRGYYLDIHGDTQAAGELLAALTLAADQVGARAGPLAATGGSDHVPFQEAGVPSALLIWREAEEAHLPTDTPDLLDPRKLRGTGRAVAAALRALAD